MTDNASTQTERLREPNAPRRILRLPTVLALLGMRKSWLYSEISKDRFPKPMKLGRASGWDSMVVESWIASRAPQAMSSSDLETDVYKNNAVTVNGINRRN